MKCEAGHRGDRQIAPLFTYGAGGGTSQYTLDIARNIKENYGVPTLAHLTCVSSTKETVHARITDIKAAGIQNVMALRGDIPTGLENADRSQWDYHHATDQIIDLFANVITNVHVYSMNKPDVAAAIQRNLSDILS